ncbi:hypothetical protein B9Z55_010992 [Caenorhabditis nigoni]|uniref:Uncharacterized protein n=1 Tax=Caenorhabditis nigoni TaxID=1611254 RepID=A0A2G5UI65_9PELO|nr:hypothetical protein B9Z55_010992 [Caenorhabditis nigoni]
MPQSVSSPQSNHGQLENQLSPLAKLHNGLLGEEVCMSNWWQFEYTSRMLIGHHQVAVDSEPQAPRLLN